MRITIVDSSTFMVMEVMECEPAQLRVWAADWLTNYNHQDYRWFVTRTGMQPEHAQHNAHGQLLTRNGRPALSWTK